ncbi:MAG: haloacid dehalogenase-like hydrolase [Pseudomonadota bacterium]
MSPRDGIAAPMSKGFLEVDPHDIAIHLAAAEGSVLLLDFDDTLWLRNSTVEFLKSTRPAILMSALRRLFKPAKRARYSSDAVHDRNWRLVFSVVALSPWTLWRWRKTAPHKAARHMNPALLTAMRKAPPKRIIVISFGYSAVIRPLLDAAGLGHVELIAAPLWDGARWSKRGKRQIMEDAVPADQLDVATFVTDDLMDEDLLKRVGTGVLCKWHAPRRHPR